MTEKAALSAKHVSRRGSASVSTVSTPSRGSRPTTNCENACFSTKSTQRPIGSTDDGEVLLLERHNWMGCRKAESGGHLMYARPEEVLLGTNTRSARREVSEEARQLIRTLGKTLCIEDESEKSQTSDCTLTSELSTSSTAGALSSSVNEEHTQLNTTPPATIVCECGAEREADVECVTCAVLRLVANERRNADELIAEEVSDFSVIVNAFEKKKCEWAEIRMMQERLSRERKMAEKKIAELEHDETSTRSKLFVEEWQLWPRFIVEDEQSHRGFIRGQETDGLRVLAGRHKTEFQALIKAQQTKEAKAEETKLDAHSTEGRGEIASQKKEHKTEKGCCALM